MKIIVFESPTPNLLAVFLVLMSLSSGCAFTDVVVSLPQPEPTVGQLGGAGRKVYVPTFLDQRNSKEPSR
jgi:hypothetical protein